LELSSRSRQEPDDRSPARAAVRIMRSSAERIDGARASAFRLTEMVEVELRKERHANPDGDPGPLRTMPLDFAGAEAESAPGR
jgi:hypothetical protein